VQSLELSFPEGCCLGEIMKHRPWGSMTADLRADETSAGRTQPSVMQRHGSRNRNDALQIWLEIFFWRAAFETLRKIATGGFGCMSLCYGLLDLGAIASPLP